MSATGTQSSKKRVKFDTDKTHQPKITTPSEAAECVIIAALAANGSLQELQKDYFREAATNFLKLRKRLHTLTERKEKISTNGNFVRSTIFKFTLNASANLLEDNADGVTAISDQCDIIVNMMQSKLQEQLIELTNLEIESVQKSIKACVIHSITTITTTLALLDPDLGEAHGCDIYQFVFDNDNATTCPLLKHSELTSYNAVYDGIHVAAVNNSAPDEAPTTAYRYTEDRSLYNVTATSSSVVSFQTLFKALFVNSWDTFLQQNINIANTHKMKLFLTQLHADTATETVATNIADLDFSDPKTVKDVIDHRVNERTKKLEQQLQKMQIIIAKNSSRGATKPGASTKKKTGQPRRPKSVTAKADGADKDSSAKKRQTPSRKKSQPKRRPSKQTPRR